MSWITRKLLLLMPTLEDLETLGSPFILPKPGPQEILLSPVATLRDSMHTSLEGSASVLCIVEVLHRLSHRLCGV